jgi:hypothetical protein
LTGIEDWCFYFCSLKSICIPGKVESIDARALIDCKCLTITVDATNHRFSIDRYFVVDKQDNRLVQYFGESGRVSIWNEVEILGESCFAFSSLQSITFERESRLTRIDDSCFKDCALKLICIPRNVEILGKSCFCHSKLESITFGSESRLTRIKESCFSNCSLKSICIPRNVEILGKSCFSYSKLESLTLENESRLTRIEDSCFLNCSLKSINIPGNVEILGKSCFS